MTTIAKYEVVYPLGAFLTLTYHSAIQPPYGFSWAVYGAIADTNKDLITMEMCPPDSDFVGLVVEIPAGLDEYEQLLTLVEDFERNLMRYYLGGFIYRNLRRIEKREP